MPLIQALLGRAQATVDEFRQRWGTVATKLGTKSATPLPSNQRSIQKRTDLPSPTMTDSELWKNADVGGLHALTSPTKRESCQSGSATSTSGTKRCQTTLGRGLQTPKVQKPLDTRPHDQTLASLHGVSPSPKKSHYNFNQRLLNPGRKG
jgi:hypothetical protein